MDAGELVVERPADGHRKAGHLGSVGGIVDKGLLLLGLAMKGQQAQLHPGRGRTLRQGGTGQETQQGKQDARDGQGGAGHGQ